MYLCLFRHIYIVRLVYLDGNCWSWKVNCMTFDKGAMRREKKLSQLTHIGLWDKYNQYFIHGHQYYNLVINNLLCCNGTKEEMR